MPPFSSVLTVIRMQMALRTLLLYMEKHFPEIFQGTICSKISKVRHADFEQEGFLGKELKSCLS